jgi:ribosome biogenesis GTPase
VKEKGCAVLEALAEGKIHPSRHSSYVRLYEKAKEIKAWERKKD